MRILFTYLLILFNAMVFAQDPHFTQFYAAPLTVNPGYAGFFENGSMRVISNYRRQWLSQFSYMNTTTVQLDGKFGNKNEDKKNQFCGGILLMNDASLKGAVKSNYISGSGAYQISLDELSHKKLIVGLMATYGNRRVDFSNLNFQEQYSAGSFDQTLPNGETALQNMKSYVSLSTGLLYSITNKDAGQYFDIGFSCFHFNRPKQSYFQDLNQKIPMRYSAQISYQKYLTENCFIHVKGLYQNQAEVNYFLGGLSFGKLINQENDNFIGAGCWLRIGDSFSPFFVFECNRFQSGISYDIVSFNTKQTAKKINSIELSFQLKLGSID